MLTITTLNKWKATTKGTLMCRACAVMVISANPPGEVAIIMVAMGNRKGEGHTGRHRSDQDEKRIQQREGNKEPVPDKKGSFIARPKHEAEHELGEVR
jgi:hypothetical protein